MQSQEAIARSIAERAERHRRAMEKLVAATTIEKRHTQRQLDHLAAHGASPSNRQRRPSIDNLHSLIRMNSLEIFHFQSLTIRLFLGCNP